MKFLHKTLIFLLVLSLFAAFAVNAWADGPVTLTFTGEETDGGYTVSLNTSGIKGIAMMQFNVIYDPSVLSCTGAAGGDVLSGNVGPTINTSAPGRIVFVWDSLNPIKKDGTLLVMSFERTGQGDATVQLDTASTVIFAYEDFTQPEYSCGPLTLKGTVTEPESTAAPVSSPAATAKPAATAAPVEEGVNGKGLTLNTNSAQLSQGQTTQLTVSQGTDAVYTSSNESVATVDESGNVTAVGEGTAVITVTNEEGTSFSTCSVTVSDTSTDAQNKPAAGSDSGSTDNGTTTEKSAVSPAVFIVAGVAAAGAVAYFIIKKNKRASSENP